jgi:LDH2 family malate/lactate/ureidoglycolate dehydrogenase
MMIQRQQEGIPVDEISWQEILKVCHNLKIEVKKIME